MAGLGGHLSLGFDAHREIWKEFPNNPELARVRDAGANTIKQQVNPTELSPQGEGETFAVFLKICAMGFASDNRIPASITDCSFSWRAMIFNLEYKVGIFQNLVHEDIVLPNRPCGHFADMTISLVKIHDRRSRVQPCHGLPCLKVKL